MKDSVHLPGMVTGKQKAALLKTADVFVCPSEHENFGLSVAEALLFGKPCIVNKGVALSEEIEEFSAGLVFNDSKEELKKSIETLYSNGECYSQCKLNAQKISSLFSAANVAEKLREEYSKMLRTV
jgi:glycosyltransferase involved in cell wall biosynthesis